MPEKIMKRGPGRPRKNDTLRVRVPAEPPPKRGPGRPRKNLEATLPKAERQIVKTAIPPKNKIEAFVETLSPGLQELLTYVQSIELQSDEHYSWAARALHKVAAQFSEIDNKRKEWTADFRAVVDSTNEALRPLLNISKTVESLLKAKLGTFAIRAWHDGRELPPLETASVTLEWTGEVQDVTKIPEKYTTRVPNIETLIAVTKACGGAPDIPGWRPFLSSSVRTDRK